MIERIQDDMVKGVHGYDDPNVIMKETLKSCTAAVEGKRWNQKTEDQKQILALQSNLLQLKDSLKTKQQTPARSAGGGGTSNARTNRSNASADKQEPWAWTNVPPKAGEKKKTVNDKSYRWCKFHNDDKGKWVMHSAENCKNDPANKTKAPPATPAAGSTKKAIANLALKENLQDILDNM